MSYKHGDLSSKSILALQLVVDAAMLACTRAGHPGLGA